VLTSTPSDDVCGSLRSTDGADEVLLDDELLLDVVLDGVPLAVAVAASALDATAVTAIATSTREGARKSGCVISMGSPRRCGASGRSSTLGDGDNP
jgi:hypothetical protein